MILVDYIFILSYQFTKLEHARAAHNLNGQLEIASRIIKVSMIKLKCRSLGLMLMILMLILIIIMLCHGIYGFYWSDIGLTSYCHNYECVSKLVITIIHKFARYDEDMILKMALEELHLRLKDYGKQSKSLCEIVWVCGTYSWCIKCDIYLLVGKYRMFCICLCNVCTW